MSSSDVGSYEFQRSSWMQMEDCSAALSRSTSDGSADYYSFIRIIIIIISIVIVTIVIILIILIIIIIIIIIIRRPISGRAC